MVAHLSSKLSHLAQSFRPQHHFNTLRNAFPTSAHSSSTTGFFDPANVFQQATAANNSLGAAAASHASGAGAGSTAGGAGGAKWHAGRNAHNWGFQNTGRTLSQTTSQDPNSRQDDDSNEEQSTRRRNLLLAKDRTATKSSFASARTRSRSISSSDRPELLTMEEIGLKPPRLSSAEMQSRYRSAFAEGKKTAEVVAMEMEADEMDLGAPISNVRGSGRRASFSSGTTTPTLHRHASPSRPLILPSTTSSSAVLTARREIHTSSPARASSSPFPSTTPPLASVPRARRNSTSAVESSPIASESSSPPLADPTDSALKVTHTTRDQERRRRSRPATSDPDDEASAQLRSSKVKHPHVIHPSFKAPTYDSAAESVRRYLAVESNFTVERHNIAMRELLRLRRPNQPITTIVHLYNQLFEHESLRPNRDSYELILRTFCERDYEIVENIKFLERRLHRKKAATVARGDANLGPQDESLLSAAEASSLEALRKEDYLSPALEIYKTLGPLADKLDSGVVARLLGAAARRQRVDLALSLFGRLEQSPLQRPNRASYLALIQMFGREKDKDSLMEVFEGYLQARANGMQISPAVPGKSAQYERVAVKHAYTTTPEYTERTRSPFFTTGDSAIWRNTIAALFEAGDSAEAIALLERMLVAQNSTDRLPEGYPAQFGPDIVSTIIVGFISVGDFSSARKWFDQAEALNSLENGVPVELYRIAFYAALRAENAPLLRHIYLKTLERAGPNFKLSVSEYVPFIDSEIAAILDTSTSSEERQIAITAIQESRSKFEQAVRQGYTAHELEYNTSTGVLARIVNAFASCQEWNAAASAYTDLAASISRSMSTGESIRSNEKWANVARDAAYRALGLERLNDGSSWAQRENVAVPPISEVTRIVSAMARIARRAGFKENQVIIHNVVVQSFLNSKAQNKGDVAALALNGDQWYTIINAFAHLQSAIRRGLQSSFEFPGFEPIVDDFAASQVQIPSSRKDEFPLLVKALLSGGMSADRARAVLAVLDLNLAQDLQAQEDAARVAREAKQAAAAARKAEKVAKLAASSSTSSIPDSLFSPESTGGTVSLPTPPSTPPPHVMQHVTSPAPSAEAIDLALTNQIDHLVYSLKFDDAFRLAKASISQGQYSHPEALGRLLEQLGRGGKIDAVRETYALAYAALPALAAHPAEQSAAWKVLEDHMIVALAQSGLLEEVSIHRDRLIQAGSAPSADGYAAMIVNMKETTNDAAVALMLFEESQRFGVVPSVYLFNTLISKLSRARRAKDALEYFELMKKQGLRPSAITYGAIINACCKTGDDATADYLFQEMVKSPGFKPRVPPYNTMIQFYTSTKPDRTRALHYYKQLIEARVQPTGHTYKLLLDCYGSIAEPDVASLEDVFSALLSDQAVAVTGAHWASLIHSYGLVGKNLQKAIQIFDSIQSHPSTLKSKADLPDAVVYEALLNAFIANDRADLCENYLVEMKERGVKMTAYVANTLIKGHAAQNNLQSARAVFDSMQDPPSGVAAAGNHTVERHPKHQTQLPTKSNAMGPVYREPSTWEAMIRAELGAGESARAIALMKRVEERAFPEAVVARIRKHLDDAGIVSPLQ